MIFVTGDTHGTLDTDKFLQRHFPIHDELTRQDYMIICGDFGGVWDGGKHDTAVLDFYAEQNFTTLFVDGNHENFDILDALPVEEWNGGKVHRVRDSIIHLMRGQIFQLGEQSIFTFGGGNSIDKEYRLAGRSWWPQEMPSAAEREEAMKNLQKHSFKVDTILTHAAPESLMCLFHPEHKDEQELNTFLQEIMDKTEYSRWYFGHLHEDRILDDRHRALYDDVILLQE